MPNRRLLVLLELLAQDDGDSQLSLCRVAAAFTNLSGAGIVISSSTSDYTTFCASDEIARRLLETEITLGEGPGIDACRNNRTFENTDLRSNPRGQWIGYAQGAAALGARAVFGFPVTIGAIRIGALILYRDQPGALSDLQESDAYLAASAVGRGILAIRAGASRKDLNSELEMNLSFDFSVHQAAGMVAIQAMSDISDAFVLLRAHAFGSGISLTELAKSVVRRETMYDVATRTWAEMGAPST